jgi:PadR family transcriptional regulator PadR
MVDMVVAENNSTEGSEKKVQPKDWLVPYALLSLRERNSYGYKLMERMSAFGFEIMHPGPFYRTLRQMEKDGMVRSSWETSKGGPARRMYSITDAGEAYLEFWAKSLEHYQAMLNMFSQLYSGRPLQTEQKEAPKADK